MGFRIFRIITEIVTTTIGAVTLPLFSRLKEDRERLVRGYLALTRVSVSIAVPVFAAGAVLAPYVIPALFGDKWEPSVKVMQILSLTGLVTSVASFDRSALIAVGQVRLELFVAMGGAVTSVIAFYVGAQFGIVGVATAIAIRAYVYWPVRMLALRAGVGVPLASTCCSGFVPPSAGSSWWS